VYLSTLTVAFVDRFWPKLDRCKKNPRSKNEFVGGHIRTTPSLFCLKTGNPHFRPRLLLLLLLLLLLQPFYSLLDFVLDNRGEPVPEETFTHSHLSWLSIIPYLLPLSIMIHGILPVQFMCLTVFFHNLCPSFLWSLSWPGTVHFILHTFWWSILEGLKVIPLLQALSSTIFRICGTRVPFSVLAPENHAGMSHTLDTKNCFLGVLIINSLTRICCTQQHPISFIGVNFY